MEYRDINSSVNYGNFFEFENQLNMSIDSLKVTVGDKTNTLNPFKDSTLMANLIVPESGYPHQVKIWVYSNSNIYPLKADSFNCYNCDGSHLYILKEGRAEYKFLP